MAQDVLSAFFSCSFQQIRMCVQYIIIGLAGNNCTSEMALKDGLK